MTDDSATERLPADGEWHIPADWSEATLVVVGETVETAIFPIALFRHADQARAWASDPGKYPNRFRLLTITQGAWPSQSSWAKEKAALERQRDEYKAAWEQLSAAKRHASRPVTAKE